jgi:hypothetical protein
MCVCVCVCVETIKTLNHKFLKFHIAIELKNQLEREDIN